MSFASVALAIGAGPAAYWKHDDTSGTQSTDASGNARHATYFGSPTLGVTSLIPSDPSGKAMGITANSSKGATIADAAWQRPTSISVFTVVSITSGTDGANGDAIVSKYGASGFNWLLWRNTGTKLACQVYNTSGSAHNVADTATFVNGQTYFVGFVWDSTTHRLDLYVDGVSVAAAVSTTGNLQNTGTSPIEVGRYSSSANTVPGGTVDDTLIYDFALTSTDVASLWTAFQSGSAATATGGLTLGGSSAASVAASSTGGLTFGATADVGSARSGAGSLTLGGTGGAGAGRTGTGSLTLGGTGTGSVARTGTGSIALGATGSGGIGIANPRDITGLLYWGSARAMSYVGDGNDIPQWDDLSVNGNHATLSAAGTNGIEYHNNYGPGGSHGLQFPALAAIDDSTAKYLEFPNMLDSLAAAEVFYVLRAAGPTNESTLHHMAPDATDVTFYPYSNGSIYESFGSTVRRSWAPSIDISLWHRYNVWSAPGDWAAKQDGVTKQSSGTNTVDFPTNPRTGASFDAGVVNRRFTGRMSMLLIFNRKLTTPERAAVETWMVANLDGGERPPTTATGSITLGATANTGISSNTGGITLGGAVDATDTPVTPAVTNNRIGGRARYGSGRALWAPPVAVPVAEPGAHRFDVVNTFSTPTYPNVYTQPVYTVQWAAKEMSYDRLIVGGVDMTNWRGHRTPTPSYQLIIPMLYGPGVMEVPQVSAAFERVGFGATKHLKLGSKVVLQRIDGVGGIVATDYIGFIAAHRISGNELVCELGGELSGRAALMDKQAPVFKSRHDIGQMIFRDCRDLAVPFEPRLGPDTGIKIWNFGGGMSVADHIDRVCELGKKRNGVSYTVMPRDDGVYEMIQKDLTTVHGTVYFDDERMKPDLVRDLAEEPNRIFASAVAPNGKKIRFAVYPGLIQTPAPPYPMAGNAAFGPGTEDADTINGDGITIMMNRLVITNFLQFGNDVYPGGYDDDVEAAIYDLQTAAGITPLGVMNPITWNALFDLSATGYSLNWSHIEPAAADQSVVRWFRTSSGAIRKANPNYNPTKIKVDHSIDVGTGFWKNQVENFARIELHENKSNWVGTVSTANSFVWGLHDPGDAVVADDVMVPRDVKPGMNLWAPLWDGGTLFTVAGATISEDGLKASFQLDTRARNTIKVWQVIARNRESRRDPARQWIQQHRRSQLVSDSLGPWDDVGGVIEKIELPENEWVVFPIVAGQEGTIARLRLNTTPNAEYVTAIFGRKINATKLHNVIGNPLGTGKKRWVSESVRNDLDRHHILLYVAGDDENPCGYFPKKKSDGGSVDVSTPVTSRSLTSDVATVTAASHGFTVGQSVTVDISDSSFDGNHTVTAVTTNTVSWAHTHANIAAAPATGSISGSASVAPPLTGKWFDDAGIQYHTFEHPVLYLAIYADRDTFLEAGRIAWPQLEDGS